MSNNENKGYISARDFVNSWEKEVYELTHLDYFIYLLINDLGSKLENQFFPKIQRENLFFLNNVEISAMAFNIGDSLQLFLDKNCFSSCSLGCPNKLDLPFSKKDEIIRQHFIQAELEEGSATCSSREDCLYHDILNYVVQDALLDFYNYEMGVVLSENDKKLKSLSFFVMEHIISFIRKNGAVLLKNPNELASDLFNKDLQKGDEGTWEENFSAFKELNDEEEEETWKVSATSIETIFADFEEENPVWYESKFLSKVVGEFKLFLEEYLEVHSLSDLEFEYVEEFFLLLFPFIHPDENELSLKSRIVSKNGRALKFAYNAQTLFNFKNKFNPIWQPVYLCGYPKISYLTLAELSLRSNYIKLVIHQLLKNN